MLHLKCMCDHNIHSVSTTNHCYYPRSNAFTQTLKCELRVHAIRLHVRSAMTAHSMVTSSLGAVPSVQRLGWVASVVGGAAFACSGATLAYGSRSDTAPDSATSVHSDPLTAPEVIALLTSISCSGPTVRCNTVSWVCRGPDLHCN